LSSFPVDAECVVIPLAFGESLDGKLPVLPASVLGRRLGTCPAERAHLLLMRAFHSQITRCRVCDGILGPSVWLVGSGGRG